MVGVEKKDGVIRFFAACYRRLAAHVATSPDERHFQVRTHGARVLFWLALASVVIGLQLEAGQAAPLPFQSNSTNPTATPTPTITPTWTPSFTPGPETDTPTPTNTTLPTPDTPLPLPTTPAPFSPTPTDTPALPPPTAALTPTLPALTGTPTPDTPLPPTAVVLPSVTLPPGTALAPPPPPPPAGDRSVQPVTATPSVPAASEAGLFAQTFIQALSFVWLGCGILVILALGAGLFFWLRRRPAE